MPLTTRLRSDAVDLVRSSPAARIFLALNVLALGLVLPQPLRALLVVPLLLFLPGHSLLTALGLTQRSDPILVVAASVALSLAIIPLVGLALWAASGRLDAAEVAITLSVIVLAPAVVGLQPLMVRRGRERRTAAGGEFARMLLVVTIGALVVAALVTLLPGNRPDRFTEVSLAGSWARLGDSVLVTADRPVAVDVEVSNRTGRAQRYVVEPVLDGGAWSAATIDLAAGRSWVGSVTGTVPAGGCLHRLRVGVRAEGEVTGLEGPTVWFRTEDPLPKSCNVGAPE